MPSITYQSHSINKPDMHTVGSLNVWVFMRSVYRGPNALLSNSIIIQVLNYHPFNVHTQTHTYWSRKCAMDVFRIQFTSHFDCEFS